MQNFPEREFNGVDGKDMKKIVKNVLGWVLYIAILVGLIYGIPKGLAYVLKTEYPMASITSGSMWPALKKGDMVFIKGIASKDEIKEGDIIVYKNPPSTGTGQTSGFTIHRVIEINEDTAITKGDANNVSDSPVKYNEIIGKAVTIKGKPFRIPFLGNIGMLINKNKIL